MSDLVAAIFFVHPTYSGHDQFVQVSQQGHHTTQVIPARAKFSFWQIHTLIPSNALLQQ
jgi:hypothetical protein